MAKNSNENNDKDFDNTEAVTEQIKTAIDDLISKHIEGESLPVDVEVVVSKEENSENKASSKSKSEKNKTKNRKKSSESLGTIIPVEQTLPVKLPIIGLNGHPIFPGIFTPLMISNIDDVKTVEDAYVNGGFIGLVLIKSETENVTIDELYNIGTVARIIRKINLPDGGINIFVSTVKRFKIRKTLSSHNPIVAAVQYLDDEESDTFETKALTRALISEMKEISDNNPLFSEEMRLNMVNIDNPGKIADFVASILNVEKTEQQKVLENINIRSRIEQVLVFIKKEQELLRMQKKIQNELNDKIDYHEKTMLSGELSCGIFVNAASVIMRLGVATTILTGTGLILSGQVDFMVLFMFLLVITRIYAPFDQALALIAEMLMSQISASRLMEIHDTKTAEGTDIFKHDGHDIVFDNVGFAYDNEQVLKGVSFTAKEGEVTALVGPSGSGKSTCAKLAARLWDISEGTIKVGGVDIGTVDPEVLLTDYSMVFQDVVLFDDTVMENIRLGKHGATDEEVKAAAKAANCDEFVDKLPKGYDTPIGENGAKLSGGERQRISIARALLKNAPIVLLDEATASLDVENETKVQGALSRLLAGKTVLVIAHRMRTVEAADKIVVLVDGKVAEEGSPSELLKMEDGIFKRMAQLQSESAGWCIA